MWLLNSIKISIMWNELKKLDNKYMAIVPSNWKKQNSSRTVWFYPINNSKNNQSTTIDFSQGIKLCLRYKGEDKELVLAFFDAKDTELIKRYVRLCGFDESIIKS